MTEELKTKLIAFYKNNVGKYNVGSALADHAFALYMEMNPTGNPGSKRCGTCVGSVFKQLLKVGSDFNKEQIVEDERLRLEAKLEEKKLQVKLDEEKALEEAKKLEDIETQKLKDLKAEELKKTPVKVKKKAGRPKKVVKK